MSQGRLKPQPGSEPAGRPDEAVAANYRYWREHGGEWAREYDRRKTLLPLYHIQEIMLVEYVRSLSPARVLEFGCGPGRHLRNLVRLEGIEVFGYDQSPTMAAGCGEWAEQEWIDSHLRLGHPTGRLPWDDGSFDLVYTAEVLVHVRPDDLPGILSELLRVSRGRVFHLETARDRTVKADEHDGCYVHDLIGTYAELGATCRVVGRGYVAHEAFEAVMSKSCVSGQESMTGAEMVGAAWHPVTLELFRRLEQDLLRGLREARRGVGAASGMKDRDATAARSGG